MRLCSEVTIVYLLLFYFQDKKLECLINKGATQESSTSYEKCEIVLRVVLLLSTVIYTPSNRFET